MDDDEDDYAVFVKRQSRDLIFQVGIDLASRDYGLSLNPSVGVDCERVSLLSAQFYGLPKAACLAGSSLADLFDAEGREGGLVPRWSVFSPSDIVMVVDLLILDLESYGFPFLEQFSSLRDIVKYLEGAPKSQFDLSSLAVAYAECGEFLGCVSAIGRLLSMTDGQPPFIGEQVNRFIKSIEAHYDLRPEAN